ncbi:MAG: alkaline phosphatase D family protein [Acidobacteriota bacterium]
MAMTRRLLLLTFSWLAAAFGRRTAAVAQTGSAADFDSGVASGDPTDSAVVLWTRAKPRDGASTLEVGWRVGRDEDLRDVVSRGSATTSARRDWTVKVDVRGLEPDRWYWYEFRVGETRSTRGRTRTLPTGRVDQFEIAVFSCSNYAFGYFNSYRSAAERDDLDLALHLGDYIYEYGPAGYGGDVAERLGRVHEPRKEILTVEDYRTRYAQYRSDEDLQALHARLPMIAVWDDHEIANNTWHSGAQNHTEGEEGTFADRKAAAVQVFHEWMPIRSRAGSAAEKIYRRHDIGDLATLIMLDTRLVGRDEQLDYDTQLDAPTAAEAERFREELIDDPRRSMLGAEQEAWLKLELSRSKERGVPWQILGQQLLIGGLTTPDLSDLLGGATGARIERLRAMAEYELPLNLDAWDGYGGARERLAQDARSFGNNVVALAGDTHNSWAFDLLDRRGRRFGVEFGTASVTSPGLEQILPLPPALLSERLRAANPHLRLANTKDRGFMTLRLTPAECSARWYTVDTVESRDFAEQLAHEASVQATEGVGSAALDVRV